MKIKITEQQAKRLNLLKENEDPIAKLEQYVKIKSDIVDNLYEKVVNLSVYELLTENINFNEIARMLMMISDEVRVLSQKAYSYIDDLPDEGLDQKIDNIQYAMDEKVDSLQLIISSVERISEIEEEHKVTKFFKNGGPIDVTEM